MLSRIHAWLRPGGRFLATWASHGWEGQEADWEGWGAPMWWSHHDAATSLALVEEPASRSSGPSGSPVPARTWLWVLARSTVDDRVGAGDGAATTTHTKRGVYDAPLLASFGQF